MNPLVIVILVLSVILGLVLLVSYVCFRIVFFKSNTQKESADEYPLPQGEIYEPYHDVMIQWIKEARKLPHEEFCITSFDGLKLYGTYYEYDKNAPMEIMFHGYRGSAERDLCGGVQRCHALGRNALIVDQRTSCRSEGNVITFGICEYRDCLAWVDFAVKHFGPDVRIILTGISMGASTVLMAAGHPLPENVIGVLADCGYSSAREIIKKCARQLHLPQNLLYPFIKLGARIWGHFDLEEYSPVEAMAKCNVPVLFIHGEADSFVPCSMSQTNYDACVSTKRIVTIPKAGHGMSCMIDKEKYMDALVDFFQ